MTDLLSLYLKLNKGGNLVESSVPSPSSPAPSWYDKYLPPLSGVSPVSPESGTTTGPKEPFFGTPLSEMPNFDTPKPFFNGNLIDFNTVKTPNLDPGFNGNLIDLKTPKLQRPDPGFNGNLIDFNTPAKTSNPPKTEEWVRWAHSTPQGGMTKPLSQVDTSFGAGLPSQQPPTALPSSALPSYMKLNSYKGLNTSPKVPLDFGRDVIETPVDKSVSDSERKFDRSDKMQENVQNQVCNTVAWAAIVVGILTGGMTIISAFMTSGRATSTIIFNVVLLGLLTLISTILCWVLWHGCHQTAAWWVAIISLIMGVTFFIVFVVLNL